VGALIGDQLMGQEKKQEAQAVQSNENRREIDRLAARTNGFDTNERTIGSIERILHVCMELTSGSSFIRDELHLTP
ncbi:MAG TPA: hypothetical protein VF977_12460, partial [Candidatus Binatia bacterium]